MERLLPGSLHPDKRAMVLALQLQTPPHSAMRLRGKHMKDYTFEINVSRAVPKGTLQ